MENFQEILMRIRDNDPTLTRVDLSGNQITDAGAQVLKDVFEHKVDFNCNINLRDLEFSNNQIQDEGEATLNNFIQRNKELPKSKDSKDRVKLRSLLLTQFC